MTDWKLCDTELKAILARHDDDDDEEGSVKGTKEELLPYLRTARHFRLLAPDVLADIEQATTFHTLNRALDKVYDYCDWSGIWLGFMPDSPPKVEALKGE